MSHEVSLGRHATARGWILVAFDIPHALCRDRYNPKHSTNHDTGPNKCAIIGTYIIVQCLEGNSHCRMLHTSKGIFLFFSNARALSCSFPCSPTCNYPNHPKHHGAYAYACLPSH